MKPLDAISRRMFPTLAAQEDRMWWWRGVCIVGIILSAYVLGRDLLSYVLSVVKSQEDKAP